MVNVKNIKIRIMVSNFCIHDMISFLYGEKNQNILNCIKRWKLDGEEMFLNKQEAFITEKRVVESHSKDNKEKIYFLFNFNYFPFV